MKLKAILLSAVLAMTSTLTAFVPTVYAADDTAPTTSVEASAHQYEFPFNGELYIATGDGSNRLNGKYYDIDMSCGIDIDSEGKINFTIYALEDFSFTSDKQYTEISMKTPAFDIMYNVPKWYSWYKIDNNNYSPKTSYPKTNCNISTTDTVSKPYYFGVSFNTNSETLFSWTKMYSAHSMQFSKNDVIGTCEFYPRTTIYEDESGKKFVKNSDGSKNYFHDTVSVTINDTTIAKTIGNSSEATITGDVNGSGTFEIADVVLLQKWLLGAEKELPDWKAADLCEDNRLDVFDLCLMRELLVE